MYKIIYSLLIVLPVVFFIRCSSAKKVVTPTNEAVTDTRPIAFPGAEGFGKYTTGGRSGNIIQVTNLNDAGAGSLRNAVAGTAPRIVVFTVSGTIHLQSKLNIKDNITIAGHSAPGDGICVADYPVVLNGNNIIVRYMRFRMGDKNQKGGMVDGNGGDDAFGGTGRKNILIDHCSLSWSTDEVFSVYNGDSTTLQWNLISEPLNYSYHFETGDKDYEHHGFGAIWGGNHSSFHHNLFAHCNNRTPRFNGIRQGKTENCDFVNNLIYNWGSNNVYAGEGGNYNIVNNYYKFGPSTKANVKYRIANPYKGKDFPFGKWYIAGNYVDGENATTKNNWLGVVLSEGNDGDVGSVKLTAPINTVPIKMQTASEAYESILQYTGCVLPVRDTLDERIMNDVRNRTGKFIDVQGGFPHGTAYEYTVNAWPALRNGTPLPDADKDGMPDDWEIQNNLNPKDKKDAAKTMLHAYYTNIEVYLNSLVK